MIKLFHGSNIEINKIRLDLCRPGKDFGKGFYLNPNYQQAYKMAVRTTRISRSGVEIVSVFEFDENLLNNPDLNVKVFPDYSEEWAEFIIENRRNQSDTSIHDFDIVVGPIADDTVGLQLSRFMEGYISLPVLVQELKFSGDKAIQYFFGTEKAIKLLNKTLC